MREARRRCLVHFPAGARILDAGCGRGEFMEAAREAGFQVVGVDADASAVADVSRLGMDAVRADAVEFMQARPKAFDGVFCAHLIEHLLPASAEALVRACANTLRPGGVLCLVTPNPGSLPTISHEFWRDPTHVRPYDLEALQFLCRTAGLDIVTSGEDPHSQRGLPIEPQDLLLDQPEDDAPAVEPAQPRLAGAVAAQFQESRLGRELQAEIHRLRMRTDRLRDEARLLAGALRRLLEVLYQPSEIFVVARRPD